jgi:hypothetical protein
VLLVRESSHLDEPILATALHATDQEITQAHRPGRVRSDSTNQGGPDR